MSPVWVPGATGLVADLLYVGYTERYAPPSPREHAYAWSFALCLAGALLSLLAALSLALAARCCWPRLAPRPPRPYWPYKHYRVAIDPDGYQHYFPYPGPYYGSVKQAWGPEQLQKHPLQLQKHPLHQHQQQQQQQEKQQGWRGGGLGGSGGGGSSAAEKRRAFESKSRSCHVWFGPRVLDPVQVRPLI